jgi:hypothetical protein
VHASGAWYFFFDAVFAAVPSLRQLDLTADYSKAGTFALKRLADALASPHADGPLLPRSRTIEIRT